MMLAAVVIVEGAMILPIAITILNVLRVENTIGPKLVNIVNHSPPILRNDVLPVVVQVMEKAIIPVGMN